MSFQFLVLPQHIGAELEVGGQEGGAGYGVNML